MNYFNLELTLTQKKFIDEMKMLKKKTNPTVENLKEVAHRNAILILEDEFRCEKEKKSELIVLDMELEDLQEKAVESHDVKKDKKMVELLLKMENQEKAIAYSHMMLRNIFNSSSEQYQSIIKLYRQDEEGLTRILNKYLLDILEEENQLPFDYFINWERYPD